MRELYLDIETIPTQRPGAMEEFRATVTPPGNITKPESIQKWMDENADAKAEELWRKTALDGTQGEIVCLSYAFDDEPVQSIYRNYLAAGSERSMLSEFYDDLSKRLDRTPLYVGHNVLGFDLRFIYQRSVILGVRPAFPLCQDSRGNNEHVADTMLMWSGWGNRIKLSAVCSALGIPVKSGGIDGSMVWDYVKAGRIQEVSAYCDEDVEAVREVYRRMTFVDVVSEEGRVAA